MTSSFPRFLIPPVFVLPGAAEFSQFPSFARCSILLRSGSFEGQVVECSMSDAHIPQSPNSLPNNASNLSQSLISRPRSTKRRTAYTTTTPGISINSQPISA